jgi:cell division protein FtsZ
VNDASTIIYEEVGENANIIFGAVIDENLKDEIMVTVIATGFNQAARKPAPKRVNTIRLDSKNLEKPAFVRHGKITEQQQLNFEPQKEKAKEGTFDFEDDFPTEPDDLDIPTFLRKQMD